MALTFVSSGGGGTTAASATTITCQLTGVAAGDLIMLFASCENLVAGTMSASDGTTSLTQDPDGIVSTGSALYGSGFYLLASVATGTVTYTVTFSASVDYRAIVAFAYRPSGTVTFKDSARASGLSTAPNSGNITTASGDGVAFGWYGEYGNNPSAELINGTTFSQKQAVPTEQRAEAWTQTYTTGYTGAASCTIDGSNYWLCGIMAFEAAGAAAKAPPFKHNPMSALLVR